MSLNRGAAWRQAQERIDRLDARLLVQHVAGCTHADLIARPEVVLTPAQIAHLDALVLRRAAGEPLAYILGSTGFHGREFSVSPAVLIPRPETEVLVEMALDRLRGRGAPTVADLGTGSGIVAISLALECPAARVSAVELSSQALQVAQANATRLGAQVAFHAGSWFEPLAARCFDLVVSNPPYVAYGDPHLERDGLPFEPLGALTDGVPEGDGLDCIRTIVRQAPDHLHPGGWLLFEHGYDQGAASRNLLAAAGFKNVLTQTDLAGIDRVSGGQI